MANKKEKKGEPQSIVVVPKKELVLEGDPEKQLEFAMKAANALMKAVAQKPKKVIINGEQYLEYGDWQTLARFFGATASVAWTKPLENGKGYEARAEVLHNGLVISSAEAMCTRDERNWKSRDEFMLRSMAQTRAAAKALRNAYGWVAELAGMKSTPAEEMGDVITYDTSPIPAKAKVVVHGADPIEKADQKREIMTLLKAHPFTVGENLDTKAGCEAAVEKITGLKLAPEFYSQIIERLKS